MSIDFKLELEKYFPVEHDLIYQIFDWKKIGNFLDFLESNNEKGGFFSRTDSGLIWERHVLESVYHVYFILKKLPVSRETMVLDVGSGQGLPGFLFFCLQNPPQVILLDSAKKRLGLLESFCEENFSKTPDFCFRRVEDFKGKFDLVIMRSVIPYPWSIEMVFHLVKLRGYFVPFLGKLNVNQELESLLLKKFGFDIPETILLEELKFLGLRHLKFLKKVKEVRHSLQRDWSEIQKEIRKVNG